MAETTRARLASFSRGATASSRSRKYMSAPRDGALARNLSLDPGTAWQERRGRLREREDMAGCYGPRSGGDQLGRHQLLGDQPLESAGLPGHERPAQAQAVDVAERVRPPRRIDQELHALRRPGPGGQGPPLHVGNGVVEGPSLVVDPDGGVAA